MNPSNWQAVVVEDDADSLDLIVQVLRHNGAEVFGAQNGRECMNLLQDINPKVIVMDLALPEMDGWEALNAIRTNPSTADIPVIAVTAYDSINVAHDAIHAGFNAYFAKPIDLTAFVKYLSRILPES